MASVGRKYRKAWANPSYREQMLRRVGSLIRNQDFNEQNLCRVLALLRVSYRAIIPVPDTNGMAVRIELDHGAGHILLDYRELTNGKTG